MMETTLKAPAELRLGPNRAQHAHGDSLANFIQERQIDSFQKVLLLLFLHQHAQTAGTSFEFARRLNCGDAPMLEEILKELEAAGLLYQHGNRYTLHDDPDIKLGLERLAEAFEDPLSRQHLLKRLYRRAAVNLL